MVDKINSTKAASLRTPVNRRRRLKKLPSKQKYIKYFAFLFLIALIQGWSALNGQNQLKILQKKPVVSIAEPFQLLDEQTDLEIQLKNLALKKPLRVGAFAIDPQTGKFINIDAYGTYCAASIIKLPILISALKAIDSKAIDPKKMLTIKAELVTGGSGHLQWQPVGTKLPFMEVARLMMIFSDNTATNMIIDALGGLEPLNKDFKTWGLKQTKLNNYLGDFTGTNKTSPYDLVYLLGRVDHGELISDESRQWMYQTLKKTRVHTLLSPGLGPGAQLAHKTGDIGTMVGDTGIVTTPEGKKYYVAIQVERPHNDLRANALIRDASKLIYGRFADYAEMTSTKVIIPLKTK
jgi:beta-lactamase class A